jgi:seryl-tRNA synthetase
MNKSDALQIFLSIVGSGALFSFLQFLIQRKDTKEDENKEIDERFEQLHKEMQEGLNAREKNGTKRFQEMMKMRSEDFQELLKTFDQLKDNDRNVEKTLQQIFDNQKNACDALNGIAHDKIVYMTDKITERGFITLKERATLDSIYIPYKKMGGNSHAKAGYEHVIELEVVSDEKANELDDMIKIKRRDEAVKNNKK